MTVCTYPFFPHKNDLYLLVINYFYLISFLTSQNWWFFTDSKFPRLFWTLLNILADINCIVIWMASAFPLNSFLLFLFLGVQSPY